MKGKFSSGLLGLFFAACASVASAEDIDLFVGAPVDPGDVPHVLLVLDNGANFSSSANFANCGTETWFNAMKNTVGGIEQCALYKVVESITPGTVKLGVMVFNANSMFPGQCVGSNGGCLVYPLTYLDAAGKTATLNWIKGWKTTGSTDATSLNIKANSNQNGGVMQEAWALFAGRTGLSGRNYASLRPTGTCAGNYVIFVGNSWASNGTPNEGGNASPKSALEGTLTGASLNMNASPATTVDQRSIILGPMPVKCGNSGSYTFSTNHESRGLYADEWARYMRSQEITTYSVGMLSSSCQPEYEALLKSMANEGGGKYFASSNFEELKTALEGALSEIQSVNSVFASVSLPVSVNTQGTYLNQVFVGMFRPDQDAQPRWFGNLKQFKMGYLNGSLKLLDADSQSAISSGDSGFISECARSFWTPLKNEADNYLYWSAIEQANCLGYAAESDTPDGNMVEKGGQSFKLRAMTPADRTVYTCGTSCSSTLAAFDINNQAVTKAALGNSAMTDTARQDLINWARGQNIDGEDISGNWTVDQLKAKMRPSAHGDVVHSRPVAVNYANSDTAAPEVVVFYGANDGMLRAVNGNRDGGGQIAGKAPGQEIWSFVAPEHYGLFSRLRSNTPIIKYPSVTSTSAQPKAYGFDGPMTAYKDGSDIWLYATMRRGGRMLYAFDVSNPAAPSLKWRIGCPSQSTDDGCTTGFSGIGQTWAVPTILKATGYTNADGGHKPMLIMGGGYDVCEDADPKSSTCRSSSKGRVIYVIDADNGDRLKAFSTDGGVVGDITVVKDSYGLAQYAYAADLNGNVYRISGAANAPIGEVAPASWVITKIASLGGSGTGDRKFLFGPDVVVEGGTHYLMLGSGDREKPLSYYSHATAVQNYFFMLQDEPTDPSWLSSEAENCGSDLLCLSSLTPITDAETPSDDLFAAKKGWYLELDSSEKVVTSALTIYGTVFFSTHQPAVVGEDSCSANLGDSRLYSINFKTAEGVNDDRYADLVGDGLPPSPVAGLVTLDDGTTVPFCIGCDPDSPLEGGEPPVPPAATQPKARVFWNVEK